jgi:hypothetical protein
MEGNLPMVPERAGKHMRPTPEEENTQLSRADQALASSNPRGGAGYPLLRTLPVVAVFF